MTIREQIETRRAAQADGPEAGFMLVFAVVLVALVLIALSVAAPMVAKDLRRDKELESQHRAEQYVRAIRLYYRKYKTYPPSIKALESTNNVRFLRKVYVDPLTGKDDWRIIHVGQNKTTVKGFFGKPLGGLSATGLGTPMAGGLAGASPIGGGSTTIGSTSALSAGFQGSTFGSDADSSSNSTTAAGGLMSGVGGTAGTAGTTVTGATGTAGGTGSGDGTTSMGPIMGVGTAKTGESILNPNGQDTYESWEFLYDPRIELMYQQANILGGGMVSQSASSLTNSVDGQSNSLNGSSTTNGAGSTGSGASGTGTTATPKNPSNPDGLF